jgi:thiamine biosynthesis lipoprotein
VNVEHDLRFHAMGSDVRLLIGARLAPSMPAPAKAARRQLAYVEDFARRLSRFRADSELSGLNADARRAVPVSALLATAVQAGLWAAQRSGGLVDPTLGHAIADAGYARSLDGQPPASLREALARAPRRRPARPRPAAEWRRITVADGQVIRPPGITIDTGGTGKGLCADAVAHRLSGYSRFVVDCGGDLAIGGVGAQLEPYEVEVEHPLTAETIRTIRVAGGGVATSGLNVRLWQTADGFAHHLLDPATGLPAWSGLIGVTALGRSALEAETLSKTALLLGPLGARRVLAEHGGVIVHDSGEVEEIGELDRRPALGRLGSVA